MKVVERRTIEGTAGPEFVAADNEHVAWIDALEARGAQLRVTIEVLEEGEEAPPPDIYTEYRSIQSQVREFHTTFGHLVKDAPAAPADEVIRARLRFIGEEFCELLEACSPETAKGGVYNQMIQALDVFLEHAALRPDLPDVADALADLSYFIEGANLEFGFDSSAVLAEVHRANMAKLHPGGVVKRRGDGKVIKPPGWTPPDVAGVLTWRKP